MTFTLPAQFIRFSPRVDGSYTLSFVTQELQPEEVAVFAATFRHEGYIAFKDSPISNLDIVAIKEKDRKGRSASQELRTALFRAWENGIDVRDGEDSETYYRRRVLTFKAQVLDSIDG